MIYSHSRLSTFETCPLQYKFAYIDNIERVGQSIEAFLGSRFHEVMHKFYENLHDRAYSLDELISYYVSQWNREYNPKITIVNKRRSAEEYMDIGRRCIRSYYRRHYPFTGVKVLELERTVMIKLDDEGRYMMRGVLDRLDRARDGTYEIHDYKTSGRLPTQEFLDEDRQLALYQIGVAALWNDVKKVRLIWHYVVFDREMSSSRSGEQLEELKKKMITLIDTIESAKEFLPRKSRLCSWCSYQDICPKCTQAGKIYQSENLLKNPSKL